MLKALLPTAALAAIAIAAPAQAAGTSVSTTYTTVGESTFVVPPGVHRVDVSLTGARGGNSWRSVDAVGGRGATVTGSLAVTPGSTLYAEVGGAGTERGASSGFVQAGGANGGGDGAADIRTEPAARTRAAARPAGTRARRAAEAPAGPRSATASTAFPARSPAVATRP
jgi:hypothetical protein